MARPNAFRVQPPRHRVHLETLAHVEVVDAAHDTRLGLVDFEPRAARVGLADQAMAVGRSRDHVQRTLARAVDLPAPRPLRDLRALVLGDGRQHLPQQHALRRRVVGFLDEDDPRALATELLLQQHLVGEVAAQPIGGPSHDRLHLAARHRVAQRLQRRSVERRAAEPVVGEHAFPGDRPAAAASVRQHGLTLTGDRLAVALDSTRHPQIRRHRSRCRRQDRHVHRVFLS